MIKKLSFTHKESGFMLPLVLFVTALVFLIISTTVHRYQNNVIMTKNQIEQLKIETLVQMSREKIKQELIQNGEIENQMDISFPYGEVSVRITSLTPEKYRLFFTITTNNQSKLQLTGFLKSPSNAPTSF
ncbi:competence type IV pilus minor pilin ComGG [Virgibacillus pantothenticus]|uniref:competence type IV pilus minor pilin ComGG n=1 Tax=Virgibacillus pantothenticus TaxID=1473 RepID=UPI000986CB4E|nr:competence type IV pilus minor pilin ComGG [Virgibacillus pantothenticus]